MSRTVGSGASFVRSLRAHKLHVMALVFVLSFTAACDDDEDGPSGPQTPQATVVTASGDVSAKVTEFRTLLGEPSNGGTPGEQPTGRREIAWDGAGADPFNNKNDFPADFFNNLGAVFATTGTGFRNDSLLFVEVDSSYAAEFSTFTPTKIFSPVGSNVMDVLFHVAGSQTPAVVSGFGVVFTDVDAADETTIELFDEQGQSLGVYAAPARSDAAGLSFVGAAFDEAIVAKVRITTGTGALAPGEKDVTAGGQYDLVVMDNFLYGEPKAY